MQYDAIIFGGSTVQLHTNRIYIDANLTVSVTSDLHGIDIQQASTIISGVISRYNILQLAGDATAHAMNIAASGTVTISGRLEIRDCDFRRAPVAPEVTISSGRK